MWYAVKDRLAVICCATPIAPGHTPKASPSVYSFLHYLLLSRHSLLCVCIGNALSFCALVKSSSSLLLI